MGMVGTRMVPQKGDDLGMVQMVASPLAATSHLDVNSMVVSTRDLPSKLLRILSSQLAIEMSQLYRYTIS